MASSSSSIMAPGVPRGTRLPSGRYPRSAKTSLATGRPMACAARTISLPDSASSTAPGAALCTARAMASASSLSLPAILYSAPCGLTWCRGTPAASQKAFSAPT